MLTLNLPYPISANRYWASRVIVPKGQSRAQALVYVTSEAKHYKTQVQIAALEAGVRKPMQGRIAIEYVLHPKRPQDWATRARKDPYGWEDTVQCIDLDNANKVLLDALKGIVFEDDKWVRSIVASRGEPQEQPGMVVLIRQLVLPAHPQQTMELV